jgi:CubicO group peptidase (beta-lactamase class C family)
MPEGVTPELMCDWDWMVRQLADTKPLFTPGARSAYLAYTFGWIIGEVVRRTDPQGRPFGTFVQEEVCTPLGIESLWLGIPDEAEPRVAKLTNIPRPSPAAPGLPPESLLLIAIPPKVGVTQKVFGRAEVRRACMPGAGGIMNARSTARFFAMLANGGALHGVRLLSEERVRSFSVPRAKREEFDPVVWSVLNLGMGGFHLGGESPPAPPVVGRNPHLICHPGAGGSIGWADPDARLAVAICHNRMFDAPTPKGNPFVPIGNAVWEALGVSG